MSLPPAFGTAEEYFTNSLSFFQQYKDLFNNSNTDILVHNILERIDIENIGKEVFDKNFDLVSQELKPGGFLEVFFEKLQKFEVKYEEIVELSDLENKLSGPLGPKKKHEIVHLAKKIQEICERNECDTVVDFGSGLGYLDQQIFKTTNLKVLGIECNANNFDCAKKRQLKYYIDSVDNVKYINHTISEHSDQNIEEYLKDQYEKSTFSITGLHACADLTIDGITIFLKMADAKALILLPCCYHKMARDGARFKNFPLSSCLKELYEENKGYEFFNVPFLRLAAQPLIKENENLDDLVFNLLARATLQLYAYKHNCKIRRNKRKAVRIRTIHSFDEYLQNAITGFALIKENQTHDAEEMHATNFDLDQVKAIWREADSLKIKAAIFVLLQNCLQPVFENFILYDRLLFLQENGVKNTCFKKIFNKKVSPRCLALISIK